MEKLVRPHISPEKNQKKMQKDAILKAIFRIAAIISGGAIADIGIYCLHFIVALFGLPLEGRYEPILGPNGIDTSGSGILKYPDFVASFSCAKDSTSECITQIQGTKGAISVHSQPSNCAQFTYHDRLNKSSEDLSLPVHEATLYEEVRDFVRIIQEDDVAEYERLRAETCQVMEVFEQLRKGAGIRYGDDC